MTQSRPTKLTAASAERHRLYELSVQSPDLEIEFIERAYRRRFGKRPRSLREDFCGTALLATEWVKSWSERTATGIDLDGEVLDWGRRNNVSTLGAQASRVELIEADVRTPLPKPVDVTVALNYSYFLLKERRALREYFTTVFNGLGPDGLLIADIYGGPSAQETLVEERRVDGFSFVWEQAKFNPIDHIGRNNIHFRFKDGSKIDKAYSYEWRVWSLPELREVLEEVGFTDIEVHWNTAEEDEDDRFRIRKKAENQEAWVAYVTAIRS